MSAHISYDKKPGIQAIGATAAGRLTVLDRDGFPSLGRVPRGLVYINAIEPGAPAILRAIGRSIREIEVNSHNLGFEEIEQVCAGGEGHYLGSANTLQVMQSEYVYPDFSDRNSPTVWEEQGKPILLNRAFARKREILAHHAPRHVSDEVDAGIRAEFPIRLSGAALGR